MGVYPTYKEKFGNNIGVITPKEQNKLESIRVAIAGVGGVGGNVLHIFTRCGISNFVIADHDHFSPSNLSRQYGATIDTLGRKKVDVLEEQMKSINEKITINKYPQRLHKGNIENFLNEVDVVIDAIDFLYPEVRKELVDVAQKKGLYVFQPATLGFGANLIVFAPGGLTYEDYYGQIPNKPTHEYKEHFGRVVFPIIPQYVDTGAYIRGLSEGDHLPTFAPLVMLAVTLTCTHVILFLLGRRMPVCAPKITWIDLFEQRLEIIDGQNGERD